jgi:DNA gyrase subunit B
MSSPDTYDAGTIVVLTELEAVRQNPAMYVGSTGSDGLHHLVIELIDNAVDEARVGECTEIAVVVHEDGSCSVTDDGRGIPIDPVPGSDRPAVEVVLTTLHSGAKFGGSSYAASAGLHGVGLACVNALSRWLEVEVWRGGDEHHQRFERGTPLADLEVRGPAERRGTRVRFLPDDEVFDGIPLSAEPIVTRLEEAAFLHEGLRLSFHDERTGQRLAFEDGSGVLGILEAHLDGAPLVHAEPIVLAAQDGGLTVDAAFCWTDGYAEDVRSFVNGVRTDDGGSHVDGLRAALARTVSRFADDEAGAITTVDVLEGLSAVVGLRMQAPSFGDQTKNRLTSAEAGALVQSMVERELTARLEADEDLRQRVVRRALDARRARLIARLATRTARFERSELKVDYDVYRRQFGIRSSNWHDSCTWLADDGLLSRHAELCDVPEEAELLDVCCGSGVVGAAFRGKVGRMIGLDITPEMVKLASERLDEVHQGTVYDLPFEDDRFDIVVNREVLHLLPQPDRPLAEIRRVLKPGGQFIVGQIVPYSDVDAFWMFRIFKKKQPLLCQMFLEEDFRRLLVDAGFVLEQVDEYELWESIDLWIDTHETTPAHRQEIHRLYHDAPREVRAVHPFEVREDGTIHDQWRWCVYSLRKPGGPPST